MKEGAECVSYRNQETVSKGGMTHHRVQKTWVESKGCLASESFQSILMDSSILGFLMSASTSFFQRVLGRGGGGKSGSWDHKPMAIVFKQPTPSHLCRADCGTQIHSRSSFIVSLLFLRDSPHMSKSQTDLEAPYHSPW